MLSNASDITTSVIRFKGFNINLKYFGVLGNNLIQRRLKRNTYDVLVLARGKGESFLVDFLLFSGRKASPDWIISNFCFVKKMIG